MKYRSFSAVIILIAVVALLSTAAVAVAQSFVPEHEELVSSENVLSVSMDDANHNDAVQSAETLQSAETQSGETQTDSVSPSGVQDSSNEIMPSTAEHIEGVGGIDLAKVSDKPEKVVMHHES